MYQFGTEMIESQAKCIKNDVYNMHNQALITYDGSL